MITIVKVLLIASLGFSGSPKKGTVHFRNLGVSIHYSPTSFYPVQPSTFGGNSGLLLALMAKGEDNVDAVISYELNIKNRKAFQLYCQKNHIALKSPRSPVQPLVFEMTKTNPTCRFSKDMGEQIQEHVYQYFEKEKRVFLTIVSHPTDLTSSQKRIIASLHVAKGAP
jgi:hypothetical protein